MRKLLFKPPWLREFTGDISDPDIVKKLAECQAQFFNWLFPKDGFTSKRLPTTNPLNLYPLLMSDVYVSNCPGWVRDSILSEIENPKTIPTLDDLYVLPQVGGSALKWVFNVEDDAISFTMETCEPHSVSSFDVGSEGRAKVRFMTELFRTLRKLPRVVEEAPSASTQFINQPILTALYAYHVNAYNS